MTIEGLLNSVGCMSNRRKQVGSHVGPTKQASPVLFLLWCNKYQLLCLELFETLSPLSLSLSIYIYIYIEAFTLLFLFFSPFKTLISSFELGTKLAWM